MTQAIFDSLPLNVRIAQALPRDWAVIRHQIHEWCANPVFADAACYPQGLSVRFADAALSVLRNVTVEVRPDPRGYAVVLTDLQTNLELRQTTAIDHRHSIALARRELVLTLLPAALRGEWQRACEDTLSRHFKDRLAEESKQGLAAAARLGVSSKQVRDYFGHAAPLSVEELVTLAEILLAIEDGYSSWEMRPPRSIEAAPAAAAPPAKPKPPRRRRAAAAATPAAQATAPAPKESPTEPERPARVSRRDDAAPAAAASAATEVSGESGETTVGTGAA